MTKIIEILFINDHVYFPYNMFFLRCLHIIRTILSGWTKSGGEKCGWTKIRTMKKSGHWQNLGGKNTNKIKNLNNTKITKFQAECAGKLISGCFTRTFVNVSKSGEREKNKSGKPKSKSGKNSSIVRILALYWFFFSLSRFQSIRILSTWFCPSWFCHSGLCRRATFCSIFWFCFLLIF